MKYQIACKCGATCWVKGSYEWDTDAANLSEPKQWHLAFDLEEAIEKYGLAWDAPPEIIAERFRDDGRDQDAARVICQHEDFEIVDSDYDDDEDFL